jgi:hypothetical protein
MRFIERMVKPGQSWKSESDQKKLKKEFGEVFGSVNPGGLERILDAGYKEAKRWMDVSDAIVLKYERQAAGHGKQKMVELADGGDADAKHDMGRYTAAMARYNGTRELMDALWQTMHGSKS